MSERRDAGARHWSTEAVEPGRALSYWVDTVCDRFLALEIDASCSECFRASLDQAEFGPGTMNLICADAQRVRRTPATIARTGPGSLMLMQLRSGRARIAQMEHAITIYPGDCVLIDGREPYDVECPEPTRSLVLQLTDDWAASRLKFSRCAQPLALAGGGWRGALCAAVSSLEIETCDEWPLSRAEVAEHVGALIMLAVAADRNAAPQRSLTARLMRTVLGRLAEPDLNPAAVAAEHRISVRSLHYAFAAAGTTFVAALMNARLERARGMLADRGARDLPVAEIAARCGFLDPSHFARRFRRAFGVSPLAYRDRATH